MQLQSSDEKVVQNVCAKLDFCFWKRNAHQSPLRAPAISFDIAAAGDEPKDVELNLETLSVALFMLFANAATAMAAATKTAMPTTVKARNVAKLMFKVF
jgi:hypothetical protein